MLMPNPILGDEVTDKLKKGNGEKENYRCNCSRAF